MSKIKQAFPGRTGMGIESGMSKLEYITTQLVSGYISYNGHVNQSESLLFVEKAKQIITACEAAEKTGQ